VVLRRQSIGSKVHQTVPMSAFSANLTHETSGWVVSYIVIFRLRNKLVYENKNGLDH
jgi:hypothetical protein